MRHLQLLHWIVRSFASSAAPSRPKEWKSLLLLALGALLAGGCTSARAQALPGHASPQGSATVLQCTYSDWSPPVRVEGVPPGSMVRWPSLAAHGDQVYVVGNDIPLLDDEPVVPRPLIALSLAGEDIGKPAGDFLFLFPKAALDSAGTLHLLWGEPDTAEVLRLLGVDLRRPGSLTRRQFDGLFSAESLWYSAYNPAEGWTLPEEVYRGSRLDWKDDLAGITLDDSDRLHVAVAEAAPFTVFHLVREPDGWRVREVAAGMAGFNRVATGAEDQVYITSIGPPDNRVYLMRSLDGGRTWEPPIRVDSGEGVANRLNVLVAQDGAVHLIWGHNLSGGLWPEVVRLVTSRDGGLTWSTPQDLDAPDGFRNLRAGVDRCGAVHVVYEHWTIPEAEAAARVELWYARWDGLWSEPQSPFPDLNSLSTDLFITPDGTLRLFWSARPATVIGLEPFFAPMTSGMTDSASVPSLW